LSRSTSKRRSAPSAPGSRRDCAFFTDRDLAKRFPDRLREAGLEVETYFEHFPEDDRVSDTEWIRRAASQGFVLLTKDDAVRRDEAAISAVVDAQAVLVILRHAGTALELAEMFLAVVPQVERLVKRARKRREGVIAAIRRRMVRGARQGFVLEPWRWGGEWIRLGRRLRTGPR
jgi:hypothetical protein